MSIRNRIVLILSVLLIPIVAVGQPPAGPGGAAPGGFGGGGFGGGRGMGGGRGGFSLDPNANFDRLANGKDVLVREEMDPQMQRLFDFMAQQAGVTNGQLTREQFVGASQKMMAQFQ